MVANVEGSGGPMCCKAMGFCLAERFVVKCQVHFFLSPQIREIVPFRGSCCRVFTCDVEKYV